MIADCPSSRLLNQPAVKACHQIVVANKDLHVLLGHCVHTFGSFRVTNSDTIGHFARTKMGYFGALKFFCCEIVIAFSSSSKTFVCF